MSIRKANTNDLVGWDKERMQVQPFSATHLKAFMLTMALIGDLFSGF